MHFNKFGSSDNNMNLLTSTSSSSSPSSSSASSASSSSLTSHFSASAKTSSASSSLASSSSETKTKIKTTTHGLNLGLWWLLFMAVILMAQQQPCECRYLPTRSHGDDLDKLRELMLQILESSNEDGAGPQRPLNEANGNTLAQRANWLNKLGGNMDAMDVPRKYNAPRGMYDSGHYY